MFKSADAYGADLNRYDAVKLLALLAMVADHLGVYFWPDALWLRALGRLAFPLFLFLAGYSGKWSGKKELFVFAACITACAALTHHRILPLNILFTIALVRYAMPYVIQHGMTLPHLGSIFIMSLVWFPVFLWCDYSTAALLFAVCGYLLRHTPRTRETQLFLYTTIATYMVIQYYSFTFHDTENILLCLYGVLLLLIMVHFQLDNAFQPLVRAVSPAGYILKWAARNTLPLYAFHVMIFMIAERIFFAGRLAVFQWF